MTSGFNFLFDVTGQCYILIYSVKFTEGGRGVVFFLLLFFF